MKTVTILGLGAGELDQLPLGVYRQLINANEPIFIRTLDHPVVRELEADGVSFISFDFLYQRNDQFSAVYEEIAEQLVNTAKEKNIIYVVPGHPMLAERTVQLLLKEPRVDVSIQGGQSYLDDVFTALEVDPIEGFQFLDATALTRSQLQFQNHILLCQVYDQMIASEVKLTLMEDLSPEHPVRIVTAAGTSEEKIIAVSLEEMDRAVEVNNLTSVYIAPVEKGDLNHQFFRLREVIRKLRGPGGCPWDQKQTHASLRRYLIEEAYEFIDAVNRHDDDHMVEELGDVLLQVMLHSQIGEDEGFYTIDDVIVSITEKMIRRHPHVFGNVHVEGTEEVVTNWDQIKKQEKKQVLESMLDDVPMSFPALLQAEELQKKAAKVGFDWDDVKQVEAKVQEEWSEFIEAKEANDVEEMEKEFGDWLFAIANLARHYKINGEMALNRTNQKFRTRFSAMEKSASEGKRLLEYYTIDELEALWVAAKAKHKGEE
ncbi:nucleoside triphosphate pyrophosphohydrolase [Halobacillus shinanisalinarum]|uniref:Nucleoside triphosphate pyrophosphohydrolase n=1 Tax=Halobacillus shinanisalinarum TaxID=2932258 RepID=A0ABY4GT90_9BACI|nr:nucleoside triphosphate pyrophosphohydrolase [Halobacillus shinanisalinarum]UOQ91360.1 nucleoside triphosphate pyrophosphohydrolase [Halobacillus shinanisalinarum]